MKRTLIIIRHAKSSWAAPLQTDFDRPLNERGERDAPVMGEKLKKLQIIPGLIIASSAKRTRQTAKKIAKEVGYNEDKISFEEKLYHCIPSVFQSLISSIDDKVQVAFIVGHNPGITEFVNGLSPEFSIDNMPTCGMVGVHFSEETWGGFAAAKKKVFLFEYPAKG